jgi:5-(carboxyamino)imidazole ribonucleotide mutase
VGTLAIGRSGAVNAGLLAAQVVALEDADVAEAVAAYRARQTEAVADEPADGA